MLQATSLLAEMPAQHISLHKVLTMQCNSKMNFSPNQMFKTNKSEVLVLF